MKRLFCLLLAAPLFAGGGPAALPGNLPPGPAPADGAAYGVTAPTAKPIDDKAGFVSWRTLTLVEAVPKGATTEPKFDKSILALASKPVKLQGFMLPLQMGEKQQHFVLTSTPPSCAFCLPGGPDQVIEIKASAPIKYSTEPIELSGKFEVLKNDPMGLYYRLSNAKLIE